ncbi:hypothetical protein QTH90_05075 [Variovorax sp. J2P1-59]|uniref:hypothetical protein n=1 Tax=Variovorax flavidus TaxID=3053501 RepID=UPI002577B43C|nr:hypothetical protein [Variovorax sp. J2P1-59]MDM0073740.1 hypothetical protein [Variovorax sp. J2P1-59]
MAHPICAPARLPNDPPAGQSPLRQVKAELAELEKTHHGIVRIIELLQNAPLWLREKHRMDPVHANAFVDLVKAELDRRFDAARATLEAMVVRDA